MRKQKNFALFQIIFLKGPLGEPFKYYHSNTAARKEVQSMKETAERRQKILKFLSDRRKVKLSSLMDEFNVSRSTIKRDIQILSCSAPIFTVQGKGGGVYVPNGWYINRIYLNSIQEALLIELLSCLSADEQTIIQSILDTFAMPKG